MDPRSAAFRDLNALEVKGVVLSQSTLGPPLRARSLTSTPRPAWGSSCARDLTRAHDSRQQERRARSSTYAPTTRSGSCKSCKATWAHCSRCALQRRSSDSTRLNAVTRRWARARVRPAATRYDQLLRVSIGEHNHAHLPSRPRRQAAPTRAGNSLEKEPFVLRGPRRRLDEPPSRAGSPDAFHPSPERERDTSLIGTGARRKHTSCSPKKVR